MTTFQSETIRVMTSLGWILTNSQATRTYAPHIEANVKPDGSWEVRSAGQIVGWGKESHPALAACDANERGWAERDLAASKPAAV